MPDMISSGSEGTTMAIPNISHEQIRAALQELDQASYHHEQWAEALYGTLICRLPADQRDTGGDAHRLCRFGQWYYRAETAAFEHHPGFAAMGLEHERMHQSATALLRATAEGAPISIRDYERFVAALKRMRLELATLRRELGDALYNLDPLTGTPSRIGMLTKLREQQDLVKRQLQSCAVAMIDLDHFKEVNDRYGHLEGDRVLVAVARHVMGELRPYDKVFRYGGEEFLIVLPETDVAEARAIVERLREGVGALRHACTGHDKGHDEGHDKDNGAFEVTISIGLTALDCELPVQETVDRADKALYAAKAAGRNRSAVWDVSMDALSHCALS
jgi:diguanylate cyclase